MADKLVKEIITTTTERFGDTGSIKEKITESREKIYSTQFTEEEINKAEPVPKEQAPTLEPKVEKTKEELVQEAAKAIDEKAKTTEQPQQPQEQTNPYAPWTPNATGMPTPAVPQYNVASRAPSAQQAKFPWEN